MRRSCDVGLVEALAAAERALDTLPLRRFLSFVRTNAPPLPGFTCWKKIML